MNDTFERIKRLVAGGAVRISDHGYDELAADGIFARDILSSIAQGIVVEDYPDYPKGPCALVLQYDSAGNPLHIVWGIPKGTQNRRCLSQPIDRIQLYGKTAIQGGGHENAKTDQTDS